MFSMQTAKWAICKVLIWYVYFVPFHKIYLISENIISSFKINFHLFLHQIKINIYKYEKILAKVSFYKTE